MSKIFDMTLPADEMWVESKTFKVKFKYRIGDIVILKSPDECWAIDKKHWEQFNYFAGYEEIDKSFWGRPLKISKYNVPVEDFPEYIVEGCEYSFDEEYFIPFEEYKNRLKEFIGE